MPCGGWMAMGAPFCGSVERPVRVETIGHVGSSGFRPSRLTLPIRLTAAMLVAMLVAVAGVTGEVGASPTTAFSRDSGAAVPGRSEIADIRAAAIASIKSFCGWRLASAPGGNAGPAALLPPEGAVHDWITGVRGPCWEPDGHLASSGLLSDRTPTGPPAA